MPFPVLSFAPPAALPARRPASPRRCRRRVSLPRMAAAPLPDDTAVDMVNFALSGPLPVFATIFVVGGGLLAFNYFEFGPRASSRPPRPRGRAAPISLAKPTAPATGPASSSVYVHVMLAAPTRLETADGGARSLPAGASVLRFASLEAAGAACAQLRVLPGAAYETYRLGADAQVVRGAAWPREIDVDVAGAGWRRGALHGVGERDMDLQARWEEYQLLDAGSELDAQWQKFVQGLGGFQVEQTGSTCRLCGGAGTVKCTRCGGAAAKAVGGKFECDCDDGRRPCEWCSPQQT